MEVPFSSKMLRYFVTTPNDDRIWDRTDNVRDLCVRKKGNY